MWQTNHLQFLIPKVWHKLFPIAKPTLDDLVTTNRNVEDNVLVFLLATQV